MHEIWVLWGMAAKSLRKVWYIISFFVGFQGVHRMDREAIQELFSLSETDLLLEIYRAGQRGPDLFDPQTRTQRAREYLSSLHKRLQGIVCPHCGLADSPEFETAVSLLQLISLTFPMNLAMPLAVYVSKRGLTAFCGDWRTE
jgi:hypothetical protein